MLTYSFFDLFYLDPLALTMFFLIGFLGMVILLFASRYMQGDNQYNKFLSLVSLLLMTLAVMCTADNLFVMLLAWGSSNALLVLLMIHKPQWRAALNAGLLAAKTFTVGFICLACAFLLLYWQTEETSIQIILKHFDPNHPLNIAVLILILIAAMTQSAIWPFHRWLLSSLNSPTPVSAIMHAGLVNGGGFLIARFAPLYLLNSDILKGVFALGLITACLGTLWKLMQHDVKRMLACSTMGQMGFMLVQCGLGLFPAAIAHLCWHGMFKANLFLSSNSAAQENRFHFDELLTWGKLSAAIVCGLIGSYFFSMGMHSHWLAKNTTLILVFLTFIMASQFALSLFIHSTRQPFFTVMLFTSVLGYFYGLSVYMTEMIFKPMNIFHPLPLNLIYLVGLVLIIMIWMIILYKEKRVDSKKISHWLKVMYMKSLNASQPHPSTITGQRNHYQYK